MAVQLATLHEGESARATKGAGSIGRSAPDGFQLDVAHAGQEELRGLVFKAGQGFSDGVLRPALRVRLNRILKKTRKRGC